MISIKITKVEENINLIKPSEMLNNTYKHGTVFRGYSNNKPNESYFINCGPYEDNVIHIWYNDEDKKYNLSTSSIRDLKAYVKDYYVFEVKAEVTIGLKLLKNN